MWLTYMVDLCSQSVLITYVGTLHEPLVLSICWMTIGLSKLFEHFISLSILAKRTRTQIVRRI